MIELSGIEKFRIRQRRLRVTLAAIIVVALALVLFVTGCRRAPAEASSTNNEATEALVREYLTQHVYPKCEGMLDKWKITLWMDEAMWNADPFDRHYDKSRFTYRLQGSISLTSGDVRGAILGDMDYTGKVVHIVYSLPEFGELLDNICL